MPTITHQLDVLNAALQDAPFLAGKALTLADLFAAPILVYFAATPEGEQTLPDRPALQAWMTRMEDTADFAAINAIGG